MMVLIMPTLSLYFRDHKYFLKRPDNKCSWLRNYSTLPFWHKSSHRHCVNKQVWLCSNKLLFTKAGRRTYLPNQPIVFQSYYIVLLPLTLPAKLCPITQCLTDSACFTIMLPVFKIYLPISSRIIVSLSVSFRQQPTTIIKFPCLKSQERKSTTVQRAPQDRST